MINNEGKGQLLTGLTTKISLWPLLDLYGKVEEIEIIDDETVERGAEIFGNKNTEARAPEDNFSKHINSKTSSGYEISFHSTHGRNIRIDMCQTTAKRFDSFWNALTFTQQPLNPFDITFMEVLKVEPNYAGKFYIVSF